MGEPLFRNRWAVAGLAALGVLLIIAFTVGPGSVGDGSAPSGSSYGYDMAGLAAYAELLEEAGHEVDRVRRPVAEQRPDPGSVVVLADVVSIAPEDEFALERFVAFGGRLVLVGASVAFLDLPPLGPAEPGVAPLVFPDPELEGISRISSPARRAWDDTGSLVPLFGSSGAIVVATTDLGEGRVYALASEILANGALADADNAALGLALAGDPTRPVLFLEYPHGYAEATGVSALPGRWKWTLGGLFAAGLVWLAAHSRRLGPPEDVDRALAPPRVLYVDSLAASMVRTRERGPATEPVRARIAHHMDRRGLSAADLATLLGLDEGDVEKARTAPATDKDVIEAGRVLARLERGRR